MVEVVRVATAKQPTDTLTLPSMTLGATEPPPAGIGMGMGMGMAVHIPTASQVRPDDTALLYPAPSLHLTFLL